MAPNIRFVDADCGIFRDKWVPVNTAWRVLRLRMEERPPMWRVAANILHNQSRTADKVWSSSLVVGRDAKNIHVYENILTMHGPKNVNNVKN